MSSVFCQHFNSHLITADHVNNVGAKRTDVSHFNSVISGVIYDAETVVVISDNDLPSSTVIAAARPGPAIRRRIADIVAV